MIDKELGLKEFYQIYIYFKNKSKSFLPAAYVRTVNKTSKILPLLRERYTHEIKMTFFRKLHVNAQLSEACNDNLWVLQLKHNITNVFDEFIEIKIPFEDLSINPGETLEFMVIQSGLGVVDDFIPKDTLLALTRPKK